MARPRIEPEDEGLSNDEIEAILERENAMPPEAHLPGSEVHLVRKEPNEGRLGRLGLWLVIGFIVMGLVQSMRWW